MKHSNKYKKWSKSELVLLHFLMNHFKPSISVKVGSLLMRRSKSSVYNKLRLQQEL